MSRPLPFFPRLWFFIPLCAFGFLAWTAALRLQRVDYVTGVGQEAPALTSDSMTGYAGATRELIVPEQIGVSYEWIEHTQRLLAGNEWRVRSIDYENAPFGREVHLSSPYRWWLALVAQCDHVIFGRPPGFSVERAARYADILLQLLFGAGATVLVGSRLGRWAASIFAISFSVIFPLAASFVPGVPNDHGLVVLVTIAGLLALVLGMQASASGDRGRVGGWFFAAGVLGGFGLWLSVATETPVVLGIALGALSMALVGRGSAFFTPGSLAMLWRTWALGGAAMVLVGFLAEYFPGRMAGWELRAIHPIYGVAWLGLGELVGRAAEWLGDGRRGRWSWDDLAV
jgi:hypothetical protein